MTNPSYLTDIRQLADSIPYGEITVNIKRVANKTVEVTLPSVETIRRENNQEYLKDLVLYIQALQKAEHTGSVVLDIEFKKGTINTLGYHTQTKKEYRK